MKKTTILLRFFIITIIFITILKIELNTNNKVALMSNDFYNYQNSKLNFNEIEDTNIYNNKEIYNNYKVLSLKNNELINQNNNLKINIDNLSNKKSLSLVLIIISISCIMLLFTKICLDNK